MQKTKPVEATCFADVAKQYIGQKVAVMCARYQYRGILSCVTSECLVLALATSVEVSGVASLDKPSTEDAVGGSIVIKNDAIELLYQPNWCFAKLPGE